VKNIQQFLGLTGYYRRFIHHFSEIAEPLSRMTSPKVPFEWGEEQETSFQLLKDKMLSPPILAFPNLSRPFILATDASDTAIGAVLSQPDDDVLEHPVAFASRLMLPRECRYSTTERECLSIVHWIQHFRVYLIGA